MLVDGFARGGVELAQAPRPSAWRPRIPVWVLDNCRRLGMPDAQTLSTCPSLTPPDLKAAWDFVAANREEIERAIRENEETDDGPVE